MLKLWEDPMTGQAGNFALESGGNNGLELRIFAENNKGSGLSHVIQRGASGKHAWIHIMYTLLREEANMLLAPQKRSRRLVWRPKLLAKIVACPEDYTPADLRQESSGQLAKDLSDACLHILKVPLGHIGVRRLVMHIGWHLHLDHDIMVQVRRCMDAHKEVASSMAGSSVQTSGGDIHSLVQQAPK